MKNVFVLLEFLRQRFDIVQVSSMYWKSVIDCPETYWIDDKMYQNGNKKDLPSQVKGLIVAFLNLINQNSDMTSPSDVKECHQLE